MAELEPERRPAVLFTAHSNQIVSSCGYLLAISVLSYCISHRTPPLGSWKQWTNLTWGHLCVVLVLFDSWLFVFFSGVLVSGIGLSYSHTTCALAVYSCISFYALGKIFIYGFLAEKVYIVWSGGNCTPRFSSPAYRICSVVLLGYIIILVLMILGKNSFIRADGMCVIGLRDFATIPLISYDLFLNVFLTAMFLWPLWRSNLMSHRLRKVATRTLYGACVSLTTSAVNVAILTAMKGQEFGWVCLGSCMTDVTLNAIVFSWVTSRPDSHSGITFDRFSLPTMDVGPLMLARSDCQERKPEHCGENTQPELPLPLPASFYDYIPRDQLSGPSSPGPYLEHERRTSLSAMKSWFRNFRNTQRRTQELVTGATDTVVQSSRASITVANHGSSTDRIVQAGMPDFGEAKPRAFVPVTEVEEKDICEC